jgi:hypothetical protein
MAYVNRVILVSREKNKIHKLLANKKIKRHKNVAKSCSQLMIFNDPKNKLKASFLLLVIYQL